MDDDARRGRDGEVVGARGAEVDGGDGADLDEEEAGRSEGEREIK